MNSQTIHLPKLQAASQPASGLPSDSLATDSAPAMSFAFLLAQQTGDPKLLAQLEAALDMKAETGDLPQASPEDLAADAVLEDGMPVNLVAAVFQQFPAPGNPATGTSAQQTDPLPAGQPITVNIQKAADSPQNLWDGQSARTPSTETAYDKPTTLPLQAQITEEATEGSALTETAKRMEWPSSPAQSPQNINSATPQAAQTAFLASPAGHAVMLGTQHSPSQSAPTLTTPVGQYGWAEEFSQKISWVATQQNQIAELRLNPPNLGPLDVVLKISDNQATALFTSPHGVVREAVENALPKLREMLADNGIMLGNATVSDQTPRDRSADGYADRGFNMAGASEDNETATGQDGMTVHITPMRVHNGMVDTFA